MFNGRWVGGRPVTGLVVSCRLSVGRWKTYRWVGGRLSVVGSLSVVGGFVICTFSPVDSENM